MRVSKIWGERESELTLPVFFNDSWLNNGIDPSVTTLGK